MPERTVVIASSSGLHARPAKIFVQAAARQGTPVRIRVGDGTPVPANSMLGVLALGATHGTAVTLDAEGPGADEALDALAEVLARDLDADESPGRSAGGGAGGNVHG
ncbi:HPr family phosphocarrier protein [Streptosporangium sp. NPDC050855]|uniref:HPr family phosphocarrier protein n=1 Tax=Streptosporangium sp. NPDC050855 TaxID=3366194 RepID=UPI00379F52A0